MTHQFYFAPHILDNWPAPAVGFDVIQDTLEPQLRMYITSHGIKTFFVRKRIGGKDKRIIIGKYGDIEITAARVAVHDVLSVARVRPPTRRKKIDFKRMTDLYLTKKVHRGEDSLEKLKRSVNLHLADLFEKNIGDVTDLDVSAVLGKINGATIRNRTHELLISIFNFAMTDGYISENPALAVRRQKPLRRTNVLDGELFARLIDAIKACQDDIIRGAFLMLAFGFAPKSRIFTMRWSDLDFNAYTWNDVPLSDAAAVVLQNMPQDGVWVFPGYGGRHITDPRKSWQNIINMAGLQNITMDDVYKYMMRKLVWSGDRETLRENMNNITSGGDIDKD